MTVRPAWEVRESAGVLSWFEVRLAFPDGACVDALAVVSEGCVCVEDVRARPALSREDLVALGDWLQRPVLDACGAEGEPARREPQPGPQPQSQPEPGPQPQPGPQSGPVPEREQQPDPETELPTEAPAAPEPPASEPVNSPSPKPTSRRARPGWPRGAEGCRLAAREYRAAQEQGVDPVLAVMCATGRSRRRSLRLIAQARDAGYLTSRHVRR